MAKSRSSQNYTSYAKRDVLTPSLAQLYSRGLLRPLLPVTPVLQIEDRRTFHPLGGVRAPAATRTSARMLGPHATQPGMLRFRLPAKVAICVRRKRRREVLFAYRQTRRGAGGSKRRNYWSNVSC